MGDKRKGYTLVWRSIWDNPFFDSDQKFDYRSSWIWITQNANYKEKKLRIKSTTYTIERGQLFTSIRKLAAKFHWSQETVIRYLNNLEQEEMITRTKTQNGTLITVLNYNKYQDPSFEDPDEQSAETSAKKSSKQSRRQSSEPSELNNVNEELKKEEEIRRGRRVIE